MANDPDPDVGVASPPDAAVPTVARRERSGSSPAAAGGVVVGGGGGAVSGVAVGSVALRGPGSGDRTPQPAPPVAAPLRPEGVSRRASARRRADAEPEEPSPGEETVAPDPVMIRNGTLTDLEELGFPPPPDGYPLVWEPGDTVALRPTAEILGRCAVLNAVLAGVFGAPSELTCGWLERNDLVDAVTEPEWSFLSERKGSGDLYGLHVEALWAFAWVLGVGEDLDPGRYCGEGLAAWLPDIGSGESFADWQRRAGAHPRPAAEVAALLDLHYCLDWGHVQALMNDEPPPGVTLPYVIGQRRWALEWAVTFHGPYHQAPPRWDEVDLAS